jgi:hypothetical protein
MASLAFISICVFKTQYAYLKSCASIVREEYQMQFSMMVVKSAKAP